MREVSGRSSHPRMSAISNTTSAMANPTSRLRIAPRTAIPGREEPKVEHGRKCSCNDRSHEAEAAEPPSGPVAVFTSLHGPNVIDGSSDSLEAEPEGWVRDAGHSTGTYIETGSKNLSSSSATRGRLRKTRVTQPTRRGLDSP
jgi:hypothetical protein